MQARGLLVVPPAFHPISALQLAKTPQLVGGVGLEFGLVKFIRHQSCRVLSVSSRCWIYREEVELDRFRLLSGWQMDWMSEAQKMAAGSGREDDRSSLTGESASPPRLLSSLPSPPWNLLRYLSLSRSTSSWSTQWSLRNRNICWAVRGIKNETLRLILTVFQTLLRCRNRGKRRLYRVGILDYG